MGAKVIQRDSISDIAAYYAASLEDRRFSIQQLEYHITKNLLLKYLPTKGKVLELGAGSGHYTIELTRAGHDVTAVELIPGLSDLIRQKVGAQARVITGDARDVRELSVGGPFDAILVMGPLYHLVVSSERASLMKAAYSLLKDDGVMISTHLTRTGVMGYMLTRYPAWGLESPDQVEQIMKFGYLRNHPRNGEFRGYFSTLDEIRELHKNLGLRAVKMHSQDPCIGSMDEIFNNLPDDIQQAWVNVLLNLSHESSALGSGRSVLCVSRK